MRRVLVTLAILLAGVSQAGNSVLVIRGGGGGAPACSNDPCASYDPGTGGTQGSCLMRETFDATSGDACDTGYSDLALGSSTSTLGCDYTTTILEGTQSGYFTYTASQTIIDLASAADEVWLSFKIRSVDIAAVASGSFYLVDFLNNSGGVLFSLYTGGAQDDLQVQGVTNCGSGTAELLTDGNFDDGTTYYVKLYWKKSTASNGVCAGWVTTDGSGSWPSSPGAGTTSGYWINGTSHTNTNGVDRIALRGSADESYIIDDIHFATSDIDLCALE